ncbi:MAG: hypothetical protein ACYCZO_17020 [Daejeonella sp.]
MGFMPLLTPDYCGLKGAIYMDSTPLEKRKVSPEKAIKILQEHGTIVTVEEAKLILDFMYKFAILAVDQIVKNKI